jgi:hypothetical protein
MKLFLLTIVLFFSCYCSAQQHIQYTYDQAGNRTQRNYFVARLAAPSTENDSSVFIENLFGIKVYPNPAPDKINISIAALEEGESVLIYLSDEQGKKLLMHDQKSKLDAIDISSLKAGIYYLRIYIKSENVTYTVVKL